MLSCLGRPLKAPKTVAKYIQPCPMTPNSPDVGNIYIIYILGSLGVLSLSLQKMEPFISLAQAGSAEGS